MSFIPGSLTRQTWPRAARLAGAALLLAGMLAVAASAQPAGPDRSNVAIGFSSKVIGNAKRSDLTAAMRAWINALAKERKLNFDARVEVFDSIGELSSALRQEKLDVLSVSMEDFIALERQYPMTGIFTMKANGRPGDQYVLLIRRDAAEKSLADLRGKAIVVLDTPRAMLAPVWLDTELLRKRLPVLARFFGKITYADKANMAIMPLFFRRSEAALMTRSGFETACELNPQLGRDLVVLMTSPGLVSSLGAFRANATSASVAVYRHEALKVGETVSGKLILNLFQAEAIVELKESDLRETRELLAEHARLLAGAPRKAGPP